LRVSGLVPWWSSQRLTNIGISSARTSSHPTSTFYYVTITRVRASINHIYPAQAIQFTVHAVKHRRRIHTRASDYLPQNHSKRLTQSALRHLAIPDNGPTRLNHPSPTPSHFPTPPPNNFSTEGTIFLLYRQPHHPSRRTTTGNSTNGQFDLPILLQSSWRWRLL